MAKHSPRHPQTRAALCNRALCLALLSSTLAGCAVSQSLGLTSAPTATVLGASTHTASIGATTSLSAAGTQAPTRSNNPLQMQLRGLSMAPPPHRQTRITPPSPYTAAPRPAGQPPIIIHPANGDTPVIAASDATNLRDILTGDTTPLAPVPITGPTRAPPEPRQDLLVQPSASSDPLPPTSASDLAPQPMFARSPASNMSGSSRPIARGKPPNIPVRTTPSTEGERLSAETLRNYF